MQLENAIYRVILKRKNITLSIVEQPAFGKQMSFTRTLWVNSDKSNTLYILTLYILYRHYTF